MAMLCRCVCQDVTLCFDSSWTVRTLRITSFVHTSLNLRTIPLSPSTIRWECWHLCLNSSYPLLLSLSPTMCQFGLPFPLLPFCPSPFVSHSSPPLFPLFYPSLPPSPSPPSSPPPSLQHATIEGDMVKVGQGYKEARSVSCMSVKSPHMLQDASI